MISICDSYGLQRSKDDLAVNLDLESLVPSN